VVVLDRGYSRYTWHKRLTEQGIFWVTRARKGMVHEVVKTAPVPEEGPILKDQIIRLTSRKALQAELPKIRRVEYRDPETGKVYVFLTNHRPAFRSPCSAAICAMIARSFLGWLGSF
jgi:hypothetical protein